MGKKITLEQIKESYEIGTQVYEGDLDRRKGIEILVSRGMSAGSAKIYINKYKWMRLGKIYKRTLSELGTQYFLEKICQKYGDEGLEKALDSLYFSLVSYEQKGRKLVGQWKIYDNYCRKLGIESGIVFPDEVEKKGQFLEGKSKKVLVNLFERNPVTRNRCVDHYGYNCAVCDFDFGAKYGKIGHNFIHVHHIVDISTIGKEYEIDPIKDLIPVCPNCHAMLHKRKPAYSIDELRNMVQL